MFSHFEYAKEKKKNTENIRLDRKSNHQNDLCKCRSRTFLSYGFAGGFFYTKLRNIVRKIFNGILMKFSDSSNGHSSSNVY